MSYLPIYSLDLETRLKVDKLAFDDEDLNKSSIEILAFETFCNDLMLALTNRKDDLKDDKHSIELLMLERDTDAIMEVMSRYEDYLQGESDHESSFNNDIKKSYVIYDMALRYRYPLGLYDTDETFNSYWLRKMESFKRYGRVIKLNYTLPSLVVPLEDLHDESRTTYVDILQDTATNMTNINSRFDMANLEITTQLSKIELPTKGDWSPFHSGWRFGYMEQRAIQAEVIMHLKNGLRNAYLTEYEWEINKYIDALNIMYYVNLVISDVKIETTPADFPEMDYLDASFIQTGLLGASMYNAGNVYADNVRMLGTRGHGIAAERANDLIDKVLGKDASILGDDNALNGADRLVNGELIQTKYCATGGKAISECFRDGKFRYTMNGKPMQIEVPKDKYDQAVQSMRERIQRGDMKELGITDPDYAVKIVRKGNISYKTAQRIAKAGTVEGMTYDAAKGMVTGIQTFGISATVSFATAIWRGESADEALGQALQDGSLIFGRHVMQHVLTQQVGRTAIEKSLRPATDYVVKNVLGSKTSAQIVNTFFRSASQTSIHGAAAMNNLSKILRGNVVTITITTAVLSTSSIYDVVNGRISGTQLFKNVGTIGSSTGGAAIGAAMGSVVPVVGTFFGGVVGGILGGKVSKKALDMIIDDDSIAIMETLKHTFVENIEELQLDRDELNYIADKVFNDKKLSKELKMIYAAVDSDEYISELMEPYIEAILKTRPRIKNIGQFFENYQVAIEE